MRVIRTSIGRLEVQRVSGGATDLYGQYVLGLTGTPERFHVEVLPAADSFALALSCDGWHWNVSCETDVAQVLPRLLPNLLDFCVAGAMHSQESSSLVLVQRNGDHVLLVTSSIFVQPGKIAIRRLSMPKTIPTDFLSIDKDQLVATRESFAAFSHWLGTLLPDSDLTGPMLLLVKLSPSALWFMRFPLTSYIRFHLGEFANFTNINWIVTDRSYSEVVYSRDQLRRDLSELATLLRGTVIIVNRYAHDTKRSFGSQIAEAIEILHVFLSRLKDVRVMQEQYTLRSVFNPSAQGVIELLLDRTTRFVFADFHTVSGKWQPGDHREGSAVSPGAPLEAVDLSPLRGKLHHIRLLRIFHCNSAFLFDQSSDHAPDEGAQPADRNTIVRQLLESGAQIVEGGITTESFFEFFYSVIQLLLNTGLYYVLESTSLEDPSFSLSAAVVRCNRLLMARGFDPISVS